MLKSKRSNKLKFIIFAILFTVIAIAALYIYLRIELSQIPSTSAPSKLSPPKVTGKIIGQRLLTYNNSQFVVPFELLSYNTINATSLSINATAFIAQPPNQIYLLNTSDECYNCTDIPLFYSRLRSDILAYNLVNSSNIHNVSITNVSKIPPYSYLIIPSGLLPSQFLKPVNSSTNMTLLDYLLNESTIIIYIGDNFSRLLLPGSIIIPDTSMPGYLLTTSFNYTEYLKNIPNATNVTHDPYYFNKTTFIFNQTLNQYLEGPVTYEYANNGVFIAFSNTLSSWDSINESAADISKALFQDFWMSMLAKGHLTINFTKNNSSGIVGIPLINSSIKMPSSYVFTRNLAGRLVMIARNTNSNKTKTSYSYIYFTPAHSMNGTISIPSMIPPGYTIMSLMSIFLNSSAPVSIQPHITFYTINMTKMYAMPLPYTQVYNNLTFYEYLRFYLPPGSYIVELDGYSNNLYASALFNISPIDIGLTGYNFTNNQYNFYMSSDGQPLSGINYTISLNNKFAKSGVLNNTGVINYTLPAGSPQQYGKLNFKVSLLNSTFYFTMERKAPIITINKQYIELGIVSIVVLLMVTLVKEPNRDEFYIDIPSLPAQKKIEIKIPAKEILSQFDKLNVRYHWKFMPLSKNELKSTISSNMRYNNMPIGITYSNVDKIVTQLMVNGYLVGSDELYAPSDWIAKSGHDIDYLATFKKLRIYLVTHGYMFTDLDSSNLADIVATIRGERSYIIIYSKTSKFTKVPIYNNQTTYLAFLNTFKLEEFLRTLYVTYTPEAEQLKIYISTGSVKLLNADMPEEVFG
ncbi:MAG: hypothetical protein ACP5TL_00705 [Candidatus Micrarchaeia archaeon]